MFGAKKVFSQWMVYGGPIGSVPGMTAAQKSAEICDIKSAAQGQPEERGAEESGLP